MTPELHLLLAICFAPLMGVAILLSGWFDRSQSLSRLREVLAVVGAVGSCALSASTFGHQSMVDLPWLGTGFDLSLRVYHTASAVTAAAGAFSLLVTCFSLSSMRGKQGSYLYYAYLMFSIGLVNGAVFANSLMVLLFFWEGLLGTTYGMITIGKPDAHKTATKAFVISCVTDLCMMLGVAIVWAQARTMTMTELRLPLDGLTSVAFVLMTIGAVSKGGSMPFHSWLPDAATDAPTVFMAFLPSSIEKLLGIYLLSRITMDWFVLTPESWQSTLLMVLGSVTLLLGAMFALVQKDYRRLLAFSSVSQVGYMILGVGTALPVGIVGGLFHVLSHSVHKTCLYFTAATVEQQAGNTELKALGGLRRAMPITTICFLVSACGIAGLPPFSGFFSKELVYDAALERGTGFYLVAVAGSFFTAAMFLRLGHAVFFGQRQTANVEKPVREAPWPMYVPMLVLAAGTLLLGFFNRGALQAFILPMLPADLLHGHHAFGGWPESSMLVGLSLLVAAGAAVNHWFGAKLSGGGAAAADHVRHTPGLEWVYDHAERGRFDPYELFLKGVNGFSWLAFKLDRANDWLLGASGRLTVHVSRGIRAAHTGNTSSYILWSLVAATLVILYLGQ